MLSKNKIKFIKSLTQKKYREKFQLFTVEGIKILLELLDSDYIIDELFSCIELPDKLTNNIKILNYTSISESEIKTISNLKTPQGIICIVKKAKENHTDINTSELNLVLDNIQDPGNMGTIIRLANWFGINNVICSNNCVDIYNPKVIQASMGGFCKIHFRYTVLEDFLKPYTDINDINIYGAFLDGDNIYTSKLQSSGFLIVGNEGNGINKDLEKAVSKKIHIPHFQQNANPVESLNVAMATSIILSEIKRTNYK